MLLPLAPDLLRRVLEPAALAIKDDLQERHELATDLHRILRVFLLLVVVEKPRVGPAQDELGAARDRLGVLLLERRELAEPWALRRHHQLEYLERLSLPLGR